MSSYNERTNLSDLLKKITTNRYYFRDNDRNYGNDFTEITQRE